MLQQERHTGIVIPAAGMGKRLGCDIHKAMVELLGHPMLAWTLRAFLKALPDAAYAIAVAPEMLRTLEPLLRREGALPNRLNIVLGGGQRQDSVRNTLQALPESTQFVLIHDAARPLITPTVIAAVLKELEHAEAATAAVPSIDTIVRGDDGRIVEVPDRAGLWQVQTPQGFRFQTILDAHQEALAEGFSATDDTQLALRLGHAVSLVMGCYTNIKVTTQADLKIAEALLQDNGESVRRVRT